MRIGSLFSGIGGLELGLERAIPGARTVWQVEADPYARAVLAKHWPAVPRFEDVRTVTGDDLPPCDLICGGFPCQDISVAGRGAGLAGEKSGLWSEYVRLVREIRPRFVVVENVAALLGRGLSTVLGDLAALGYDAVWDCVPAQAVGAHHRRDRLFIVAYSGGSKILEQQKPKPGGRREAKSARDGRPRAVATAPEYCEACAEVWCKRCSRHWALCGCPGEHDGDVIDCPAEPRGAAMAYSDSSTQQIGRERLRGGTQAGEFGGCCENKESRDGQGLFARSLEHATAWQPEPSVGRVADGVPNRVDRLRCLGNAVVPQVAEVIGRVVRSIADQH